MISGPGQFALAAALHSQDDAKQLVASSGQAQSKFTTDASGSKTAAVGDLTGAGNVVYQNTNAGAVALTTRTAAQMWADFGYAYVGMSWGLTLIAQGAGSITLTAPDASVTLVGTMTVATKTTRQFICTFTSPTAVTIQSYNKGTIE